MKRSKITIIFLLPSVALLCVFSLFLLRIPASIADYARKIYGPSSGSLAILDEVYLSGMLILQKDDLTLPTGTFRDDIQFEVTLGESPYSVSNRLQADGLIHNSTAFRNYLVYKGIDTQIQAGTYTLNFLMSPVDIAQSLLDPIPSHIDFVVLAGWRAEEIAAAIPTSGLSISPEHFLEIVDENQAEGYLYPGVYTLEREISPDFLLRTLMNAFNHAMSDEIKTGIAQQGLTVSEAMVLASIVEREAIIDDEMPMIASVFLNRYNIMMKLDADPTVQYAVGYNHTQATWWTNPLSTADLGLDSAYNTYLYPGLPPAPICNPGMNALLAVAFPAQSPYYYFRATCDNSGRHNFAVTFEEHVGYGCP